MRVSFRVFRVFRGSSFPDGALTRVTADAWQRCLPGLMAAKDCLQRMAVQIAPTTYRSMTNTDPTE